MRLDYKIEARKILKRAVRRKEGTRRDGYTDDKCLVKPHDLEILIGAGGRITDYNCRHPSSEDIRYYYHSVFYMGHHFMSVTYEPISLEIDSSALYKKNAHHVS